MWLHLHTHSIRRSQEAEEDTHTRTHCILAGSDCCFGIGWGCEKDVLPSPSTSQSNTSSQPSVVFRSEGDSIPTILGAAKANPYTVENMTLAWNYLFGEEEEYDKLPATHQYIKFSPQDLEEFKALEASATSPK